MAKKTKGQPPAEIPNPGRIPEVEPVKVPETPYIPGEEPETTPETTPEAEPDRPLPPEIAPPNTPLK